MREPVFIHAILAKQTFLFLFKTYLTKFLHSIY